MTLLRVAVVGVGEMGANHARVFARLKGASLVGVTDTSEERAQAVATQHGCRRFKSAESLIGEVDAVTVAVPSSLHAEVAAPLLEAGVHCLIEKPLATSAGDAQVLIEAARKGRSQLLVGHIERFNPAVEQLARILRGDHHVLAVDARRMSAVSSRVMDVDVVEDLMIHDLDIVLSLIGERPVDVTARGVHVSEAQGQDYVTSLLTFPSGALASLTASRVTQNQVRELQVTTDQRFFTIDYPAQELLIYRQGRIGTVDGGAKPDGRYVLDVSTERVFVRRSEPLAEELAHFIDVAHGVAPKVSGEDALAALQVAWEIQHQVRTVGAHA